ncbi:MAG: type II and III secretion system protein family protein [Rhodospirillales bacterium]
MWTPNFGTLLGHRIAGALWALVLTCVVAVAAVQAGEVVGGQKGSLRVEVNKGSLVRLDRPAATVFVADPEVCDIQVKSPRLVYLLGKKPGQTTLYAVDAGENVLANIDVTVSHNLSRLNAAVRDLYPEAEITVTSVEDSIVIDGMVDNAGMSENVRRLAARFIGEEADLINRIGVSAPVQVNLRVRIAEVSRDIEKQLGFNWRIIGEIGNLGLRFTTFNPFTVGATQDTLTASLTPGSWDINAMIDALDDEGLISVLAEPNVTALTGETASFLAGGEFPILVPQGNDRVTVEFKKFGVSLAFTPTILGGKRINLHVRPEVSKLSDEGAVSLPIGLGDVITIPALVVRRAETTVELASGQSFAIAGLLANNSAHDIHKFPFLADIPVLGGLFKSDRFRRNETELVIIVTPYIVRPSPTQLAAPNDGFSPPTDLQRLFTTSTWQRGPAAGEPSTVDATGTRLVGRVGYLLD